MTKKTHDSELVIAVRSTAVARKDGGPPHQIREGRVYEVDHPAVAAQPDAFLSPDDYAATKAPGGVRRAAPETTTRAPGEASSATGPTNAELRAALEDAGVEVPSKATKKDLQKLLAEHQIAVRR